MKTPRPGPAVDAVATAPEPVTPSTARIHAGTSGWAYPTWKPGFYPAGLPARRFLEHYASRLTSVEVNYTFRTLPSAAMLAGWLAATPVNFRFSFKAPQGITHFKRLRECDAAVSAFVAALEPVRAAGKLGPLLFQLPPNFKADHERLAAFLALPALTGENAPTVAFEFRHESWFCEETYLGLRARNAAMCIAESDDLATPEEHCVPNLACYRMRRSGGYTPEELAAFARKVVALSATAEVYVFFKHEDEPTGALNAEAFLAICRSLQPSTERT